MRTSRPSRVVRLPVGCVPASAAVPAAAQARPAGTAGSHAPSATVRTRVTVPLRFADGYLTTGEVVTFEGLADGREHLAIGLGDWRSALAGSTPAG